MSAGDIPVHELDVNVNDPQFAVAATAGALLDMLKGQGRGLRELK